MIPHSKTTLEEADFESVFHTLRSGRITSGYLNEAFADDLAQLVNRKYISVYSTGSTALYEILLALEVKPGDEILLPSYICDSVLKAVKKSGATPVLYDNAEGSWVSSKEQIEDKITPNSAAIILNYTFGIRLPRLESILSSFDLPIIEDCCHSLAPDSEIMEKPISGSLCSFYSFNATKLLATGEGGAVSTNDEAFFKKLENNKLDNGMSDLLCSLGISQLKKYNSFIQRRKDIAQTYMGKLPVQVTSKLRDQDSVFFRFPVWVSQPDKFLDSKDVIFRRGVDELLHVKEGYNSDGYTNVAEVYRHTVSVPIYPSLADNEIALVIETFNKLYEN